MFPIVLCIFSVKFMRSRLDADQIGIILLPNFLEEFFPGQVMKRGVQNIIKVMCVHVVSILYIYIYIYI